MSYPNDMQDLMGRTAVDPDGDKIGKVGQIYLDDSTGQPVWVTVQTGLFGTKESFAPLAGSRPDGDNLVLAVPKDVVKGAPSIDSDGHTSDEENATLYDYYRDYLGAAPSAALAETGDTGSAPPVGARGTGDQSISAEDVGSDPAVVGSDEAMTRSEERLHVGTENREVGRARLRKYVVTENVTQTVPVTHEEVRVVREPIDESNRDDATAGEPIGEAEHEVVLHAEQPVVQKETVPVERVRLDTETVTEEHEVNETIRKEQIDEPEQMDRG